MPQDNQQIFINLFAPPALAEEPVQIAAAQVSSAKVKKDILDSLISDINKNTVNIPPFATLEELVRIHKLPQDYKFKYPKVLVGIEVEVENVLQVDPNIGLVWWRMEQDGSLRNNGKEFKSSPMPLPYIEPALTQLFHGLNESVDFSNRTSIHVHMDVRALTMRQLICMLFAYTAVENLLFKFVGTQRKRGPYCVPLVDAELLTRANTMKDFAKIIAQGSRTQLWNKYSALNLLPVMGFGTVEFRQMPGNNNIRKILIWLDLLSRLKIFAYKFEPNQIVEMIQRLNTNSAYQQFVEAIFTDLIAHLDLTNIQFDMEPAVDIIKNCTALNEFHAKCLKSGSYNSALAVALNIVEKKFKLEGLSEEDSKLFSDMYYALNWNFSLSPDMQAVLDYLRKNYKAFIDQIPQEWTNVFRRTVYPKQPKKELI